MNRNKLIIIIFIILVIALGSSIYVSQNMLSLEVYEIESEKIDKEVRIIQLTDLHNRKFGENNEKLIKKVKSQNPDIITMTGDMINYDTDNFDKLIYLIEELNKVAPIYFSLGNHEIDNKYKDEIIKEVENSGAIVLEESYKDISVNNNNLRIGGVYDYIIPNMDKTKSTYKFSQEFDDTNSFKLLLSHIPDSYVLWGGFEMINPDLVLSGHYHGGLIRLPFIGGLFAPEQGYFPKYDAGKYDIYGNDVIISRGLGTGSKVPRINNIPEVSLIILK